jgi:hypothetical protein
MPPEVELFYQSNSPEDSPPLSIVTEYIILDAMKEWGYDPERWDRLHPYDQARMMALVHVKRSVEGYQTDWYRHKAKQEADANKHKTT